MCVDADVDVDEERERGRAVDMCSHMFSALGPVVGR